MDVKRDTVFKSWRDGNDKDDEQFDGDLACSQLQVFRGVSFLDSREHLQLLPHYTWTQSAASGSGPDNLWLRKRKNQCNTMSLNMLLGMDWKCKERHASVSVQNNLPFRKDCVSLIDCNDSCRVSRENRH